MKIGREEIMGMLAAVEAWTKRDMQAEYALKRNYLAYIADRMKSVPGVTSEILDTKQLSNHAPRLAVRWDRGAVPLSGRDVAMLLYEGSPRIDVGPSNRNQDFPANSITVGAHMMMPGMRRSSRTGCLPCLRSLRSDRTVSPAGTCWRTSGAVGGSH
jgi:hypothetical protein